MPLLMNLEFLWNFSSENFTMTQHSYEKQKTKSNKKI